MTDDIKASSIFKTEPELRDFGKSMKAVTSAEMKIRSVFLADRNEFNPDAIQYVFDHAKRRSSPRVGRGKYA